MGYGIWTFFTYAFSLRSYFLFDVDCFFSVIVLLLAVVAISFVFFLFPFLFRVDNVHISQQKISQKYVHCFKCISIVITVDSQALCNQIHKNVNTNSVFTQNKMVYPGLSSIAFYNLHNE